MGLTKLNYDRCGRAGSAQNLIFVHGSGCNRKFLKPLARKLKDFNCYLIDLPNHGKSRGLKSDTVEDYINAVADFAANLPNVTLIGHSLGGTICLGVAARQLPSVKRAVIISSAAKFDQFDRQVHEMVANQQVNWPYVFDALGSLCNIQVLLDFLTFEKPEILLKDFAIDIKLDIESEMSKIRIPTLIMVGRNDFLTVPEYSYRLKRAVKRSKLIVVPGYKHMLPIANRQNVAAVIRKFVHRT